MRKRTKKSKPALPIYTEEQLADPLWRIRNLYQIRTETGRVIPFTPNKAQEKILHKVFVEGYRRILIPKSRRQGVSTLKVIIDVDMICFTSGIYCSITDKTQQDAKEKIRIAHIAAKSLQKKIPGVFKVRKLSEELIVQHGDAEPSSIMAGSNKRGGDLMGATISELGTIAVSDPKRAQEIIDGTLPAARHGLVFIETTVKGGKQGAFYKMVMESLEIEDKYKSKKDWIVVFLPWWEDPNNLDHSNVELSSSTTGYFTQLKANHGIECTREQQIWWQRQKRTFQDRMNQEYPSTLDECFDVPVEGVIYSRYLNEAKMNGRIDHYPYDRSRPCFGVWDLGAPRNCVCAIMQRHKEGYKILHVESGSEGELNSMRASRLLLKYPTLNTNIFPWDADNTNDEGRTKRDIWSDAGLPNILIAPKTSDIWIGINRMMELFDRLYWDDEGTATCRSHLLVYRSAPNPKGIGYQNKPVHDYSSHWADCLRVFAEAEMCGIVDQIDEETAHTSIYVNMGDYYADESGYVQL